MPGWPRTSMWKTRQKRCLVFVLTALPRWLGKPHPSFHPHRQQPRSTFISGFSASISGDPNVVHWNDWQPWVCMCQLHKQARIRHFAVWGTNVSLDLRTSEFWQEKPCSLQECSVCRSEDCPGSVVGSGFLSRFQSLSSPRPHEVKIPLPPHLDFPSYDSLPVIDDKDGE